MSTIKQLQRWLGIIVGTVSVVLLPPHISAKTYRNREFGIVLPLPKNLPTCADEEFSHDHGPNIILDGNASDCRDTLHRRAISIFAFYNATTDTDTLADLLRWTCGQVLKGPCTRSPQGLRFGESISAATEVRQPSGWINVAVVTQNNTGPTRLNYIATLTTDRAHMDHDLRTFAAVLRSMRIVSPQ